MSEGIPVKLHITSSQSDGRGAMDSVEFYTEGKYYEKQGGRYIAYEESEISGLEGTTTILKLGREEAVLFRSGAVNSKMLFRTGCKTSNTYRTAYGEFDLHILTQKFDIKVCNSQLNSVYLKYKVGINSGEAFINEMTIKVHY